MGGRIPYGMRPKVGWHWFYRAVIPNGIEVGKGLRFLGDTEREDTKTERREGWWGSAHETLTRFGTLLRLG